MITLYRCLLQGDLQPDTVLRAAREVGDLDAHSAVVSAGDGSAGLELRAPGAKAELIARRLSDRESDAVAPFGRFHSEVAFAVDQMTPQSAGLAWDALVAASAGASASLWLSNRTYGESVIRRVATLRPVSFPDGGEGHLLSPREFEELLELPV